MTETSTPSPTRPRLRRSARWHSTSAASRSRSTCAGEPPLRPVRGVSFSVRRGHRVGIVGESGSGKSLTALSLIRLLPPRVRIAAGEVHLRGRELTTLSEREMASVRGGGLSLVYQDPMSSLNPLQTVGHQVVEAILTHDRVGRREAHTRAVELLRDVGIPQPERRADDYPHEFSGGMRQRVVIAMAICASPDVLIADEATTALDVTTQARIMDMLARIVEERRMGMILITHDLGLAAAFCDDIHVMYAGRFVESGSAQAVLGNPVHPYSAALLESICRLDTRPAIADRGHRRPAAAAAGAAGRLPVPPPLRPGAGRLRHGGAAGGREHGTGLRVPPPDRSRGDERHPARRDRHAPRRRRGPHASLPPRPATLGAGRPCRRRRLPEHREGRDPRARRRVGIGQVDARAAVAPPRSAHRRARRLRGTRRVRNVDAGAARAAPEDADRVPGPVRLAQPAQDRRADHLVPADRPRAVARPRGPEAACLGAPRARRPPAGARRRVPAPALRRPVPAGQHRTGARAPSELRRARRGRLGRRRLDPGPDPQPPPRAAAAAVADVPLRHARPCRGALHGHHRGGHVPRQDRRAGPQRGALRGAAAPVHARAPRRGAAAAGGAAAGPGRPPGGGRLGHPALGLPLPPTVPAGPPLDLPDDRSAAAGGGRRAHRRLPLPAVRREPPGEAGTA